MTCPVTRIHEVRRVEALNALTAIHSGGHNTRTDTSRPGAALSGSLLFWGALALAILTIGLWMYLCDAISARHRLRNLEESLPPGTDSCPYHDHGRAPTNFISDHQIFDDIMKKPLVVERPIHSQTPLPLPSLKLAIPETTKPQLSLPTETWRVMSSWGIRNPTRAAIPRAFDDHPKGKPDLLHCEAYKLSLERRHVTVSERLLQAQKALNECETNEVALLLGVEQLTAGSDGWLASNIALAAARAARKSLEARIQVCQARLAQAELDLQKETDALEEALTALTEADHQVFPIVSAFLAKGWSLADLPIYSVEGPGSVFPSPPSLSEIKSTMPDPHPSTPNTAMSLSVLTFSSSRSEIVSS